MQIVKYFILLIILAVCSLIGRFFSKKYAIRVKELEEMKNALNMFKTKIKFTYEPIPEIFDDIAENTSQNVGQVFKIAKEKMKNETANIAWNQAVEESESYLNKDDKYVLKSLSKLLSKPLLKLLLKLLSELLKLLLKLLLLKLLKLLSELLKLLLKLLSKLPLFLLKL